MPPKLTALRVALALSLALPVPTVRAHAQPAAAQSAPPQLKGYYRTPAIWKNTIVFTAEGDLWKYDLTTGAAARLTTHEGLETNPVISPDGQTVAFTGQYEGPNEVYVMPLDGGVPRRLTYDLDGSARPTAWLEDGRLLYATSAYSTYPIPQLRSIDTRSLATEPVPLSEAADGVYDENGVLFFTRLPNQGSKTKRYKGGYIQQIWRFDGKSEAVNLTGDFDGTSSHPMLYNGRVYFLSDRDGTMNIWSMDKSGKDTRQETHSSGWDIESPSMSEGRIVYQKGADLWLYDTKDNSDKMLDIRLLSDFDQRKPKWIKSPVQSITDMDLSPNGKYVAIISRGRVFVSPAKSDRWIEVTRQSGIRCKAVHFVNEHTIAVLSDASGEYEIWSMSADGSDPGKQLTRHTPVMIRDFAVSPDGKYIAYDDKNDVLRIVDAATGATRFEYDKAYNGIGGFDWSPDSRFLIFGQGLENDVNQLSIVDRETMKMQPITTSRLNSFSPAWSSDGKWLYFVSERNLHTLVTSPWGPRQPEPFYTDTRNFYAMPLDTAARFPFLTTDSWLTDSTFTPGAGDPTPKQPAKTPGAAPAHKTPTPHSYDWPAIQKELYELPVKSGNLGDLQTADGWLYWLDYGPAGNHDGSKLYALKTKESKKYDPVEVAAGVASFTISTNKKRILVTYRNGNIAVDDAGGAKIDADKSKVELASWNFLIDPVEEWKEEFADAWRMMRDYFYDRDLHKVDWLAVRKRYEPLVGRLTDRYELDDLLAQMVGELSALHTFVYGGDKRISPDRIPTGFLGARLTRTPRGYTIEHIYQSDPDYPDQSSPLDKPELRIHEGDIITAVDNAPLDASAGNPASPGPAAGASNTPATPDISMLLANKVDVPVKLTLLDRQGHVSEAIVRPISSAADRSLRYGEWELTRRERTETEGSGDIGYIHLRAMGAGDMDDFVKQYYPIFNRKGLILDVRHNNGGNIDSWVLEKLLRKAWMYWQSRSGGPTWNMQEAFRGHMVILCDQTTASDGEAITEGFRRLGMGKVIGMRTWGGEIWLSQDNRLVDNGIASAAEMGVFGPEGKWLIEGHGVDPDIVVDNLPYATYRGGDAQLDAAIDYLKKKIAAEPVEPPKVPPHPDKSFKYAPF
ncbi:MAG TPA: S41 family peptidase [Puia sp.]|nr:S41 family peptidase [Puia sp.]